MLKELQNFKTKKIEKIVKFTEPDAPKVEDKKFENSLKAELEFRRKKLNEHRESSEDENDEDWSD